MARAIRTEVILRAQQKVRAINTARALDEFEGITDITEIDWLLAHGDRTILKASETFDYTVSGGPDYNERLTVILANAAYDDSIERNNLPCLTREERRNLRKDLK